MPVSQRGNTDLWDEPLRRKPLVSSRGSRVKLEGVGMFLYSRSHHGQVPWRRKGWIATDVCKCLYWFLFCCFCRRDVFACIGLPDGDTSWEHRFSRWPLGVCDYLVPVKRQFHPEEWVHRTRRIYNWSEPHNRCTRKHTKALTSIERCVFNQVKIIFFHTV